MIKSRGKSTGIPLPQILIAKNSAKVKPLFQAFFPAEILSPGPEKSLVGLPLNSDGNKTLAFVS